MKYKCLILDHDDTVVNSTEIIHYPAFCNFLNNYRKDQGITISLDDYFKFNFDPGFSKYCYDILGLTEEEMTLQTENWLTYVKNTIPKAYQGMREIIKRFKDNGGYVCVISHSMKENIIRDYKANGLEMPDLVYGWECEPERRKPSPIPVFEIMDKLKLKNTDLVIIDDLKPGKIMASKANVDFIGAGWAHSIKPIEEYMKRESLIYCKSITDLERYLFKNMDFELINMIKGIIDPNIPMNSNLANIASLLYYGIENTSWAGFYLYNEKENCLFLDSFQGPVACVKIMIGKGVCGKSAETLKPILVDNVLTYEGHIACSSLSRSEVVVPIIYQGKIFGVIDLDSNDFNNFNQDTVNTIQEISNLITKVLLEKVK